MADMAKRLANLSPAQRKLLEQRLQSKATSVAQPIAVVGMACRLAGANNIDEYWQLINSGQHAFQEIPEQRWEAEAFYDEDADAPGKMATKWCAFVNDVDKFDSLFFGIAPREASAMDPQQRLLLEVSWEAVEHAGIAPERLAGSQTGVFVGIGGTDYSKLPSQMPNYLETISPHVGTGNALSIAANRISYIMDLRGPSVAVDTACSSGSVGLHLAVQELRAGNCDTALAGAVNLILSPEVTIAFSKARMLSPTGLCRPFDQSANGYVRGEGCGMLVLKRLTDALRDDDNILGVIRGTAINQDGRTSGITAPNSLSQVSCIRSALASAGVGVKDISYVEAHGTGTPLGDPIEMQSLTKLFAKSKESADDCYVASVKANIGHTETVSGIAGLIKVLLMMKHGTIPAQFGLDQLNENINLDGSRLKIPKATIDWPTDKPCIAGVSSFGFGGTNSHIIVEAASPAAAEEKTATADRTGHLLAISAKSAPALKQVAENYRDTLAALDADQVADFCYSANIGRSHFNHRAALVTDSQEKLLEQLEKLATEKRDPATKHGEVRIATKPRVAMLFTGQGSQFAAMGKTLYETSPVMREVIDQCDEILKPFREKSLKHVIFEDADGLINETAYTQPALFALEYGLAKVWQSWGVEPSVVLGHSVGEYVAACVAGVFSLEDGLKLIAKRGELMQQLPPNGTMAVVFAPRDQVEEFIKPFGKDVAVATANGPENNVISGSTEVVDQVVEELTKAGIGHQKLTVSHAFHSPLMDPMLDEFEAFASELTYNRPTVPIVANRTGKVVESNDLNAAYWRDHIRNCVEFEKGIRCIDELGVDAYLEVGPTASLSGMGRRCLPDTNAIWVSSMRKRRDEWKTILTSAAELYVMGVKIDWLGFDKGWQRQRLSLPSYPFAKVAHWYAGGDSQGPAVGGARGPSLHPLLGSRYHTALKSTIFEARMSGDSPNFLQDHVVQGSVIVPAAAFVEQGLASANIQFGKGWHAVENLAVQLGMFLPKEGSRVVETIVANESNGRALFETHSIDAQSDAPDPKWMLNVTGTVVRDTTLATDDAPKLPDVDAFRAGAIHNLDKHAIYDLFAARSLDYGPTFQVLNEFSRNQSEAIAKVDLHDNVKSKLGKYHIHPVVGDAMMQLIAGTIPLQEDDDHSPYSYVPMRIKRFRQVAEVQDSMWLYARRVSDDDRPSPEMVETDVFLISADNQIIAEARGVTVHRMARPAGEAMIDDVTRWMHQIEWQADDTTVAPFESTEKAFLIVGNEDCLGGALAQRLANAGGKVLLAQSGDANSPIEAGEAYAKCSMAATEATSIQQTIEAAVEHLGPSFQVLHTNSVNAKLDKEDSDDALDAIIEHGCANALRLIQQLTTCQQIKKAQLTLVTCGAQPVSQDESVAIGQSPLWGFGRVAILEAPDLQCHLVDLDPQANLDANVDSLLAEVAAASNENQVAVRNGKRFVARIVEAPQLLGASAEGDSMVIPSGSEYRLRIRSAGSFDSLEYEAYTPTAPEAGQVELEIRATGLNFSDVLKALGLYPGITDAIVPIGIECAGVVTAVGEDVTRFQVGDEVMGVVPYSFASRGATAEYALVPKPSNIDFEEAATIPITFLTAYYAIHRLAGLQKGERFLIHAGAGGVGLAAIQIAKQIGAEIFATAGSDEKREFLKAQGVDHVMNSRTLEFADEIMQITNSEGVDAVLNSLPGDAIEKSLGVLRAYGRFMEIGKTDIYSNTKVGLLPFQDNLSYFAIDLDRMLRQRGQYIQEMFVEMMKHFEDGTYQPLPFTQFGTDDTIGAFRYMAQRKNIGKVVVSMQKVTASADGQGANIVNADGTYLVTGGLGALGMRVADSLIRNGAAHVALMSRRSPDADKQAAMAELAGSHAQVIAVQGDVADAKSLESALEQIPSEFPPLKGVIHAAGVLDDGVMFDMDLDQLHKPLTSKIYGTWNLHRATESMPLDFFVMFSSVACVLGSPGQSNYAAGNAFLDGMVGYRRAQGLAATSINWGPWADSGMAAEAGRDKQLSGRGMHLLDSHKALDVFSQILNNRVGNTAVMSVSWSDLVGAMGGKVQPVFSDVAANIESGSDEGSAEDRAFREALVDMPIDERLEKLVVFFGNQLAHVMGMEPSDVDVVSPLNTMGMDSLMAIELKNKIERRLQTTLPMSALIHDPSVTSLAEYVANNYGEDAEAEEQQPAADPDNRIRADNGNNRVVQPHATAGTPAE